MARDTQLQDQSILEDLGYTGPEGRILLLRIQLVKAIRQELSRRKWSQNQAARELGLSQPRISELMQLRIDQFSLEKLAKILYCLDRDVEVSIKKARR